jgi:hypothetical protein
MLSGPRALYLFGCIACCCILGVAKGDEESSARPQQVDEWIQQLGDESYEVREKASGQLSALGLTVKPELLAGMRSTDPEIRWRCARLWEAVRETDFQLRAKVFLNDPDGNFDHEFPDWDRYRKLFGTSQAARQTFLSLQKEEPMLWEESANAAAASPRRFLERCRQLRSAFRDEQARTRISGATAITVLFMAIRYATLVSEEDRQLIKELWEQSAVVDLVRSDASWGAMRSKWLRLAGDERPAFERMMDGLRNGGKDVVPIARALLRNQATPASQKQIALLALAKYRFPEDDTLVQEFVDDASPIDTYFSRGVVIKSQLRDIALATLIVRADKDPPDFGFKYLRRDDRILFSSSTLGFKDDDERRAAFEKWFTRAAGRDDGGMP